MKVLIFIIAVLVSAPSLASDRFCTKIVSSCKAGDVIEVTGRYISRYCDFRKQITTVSSIHNIGDNKNITLYTVACVYIGKDRSG